MHDTAKDQCLRYRRVGDERNESHRDAIDSVCLRRTIANTSKENHTAKRDIRRQLTCDAGGS